MVSYSVLLDEVLGISDERLGCLSDQIVLVKDCVEISGAFVLHHFMKNTLSSKGSGDAKLILLSFAHPFSHYDRILRKLGCNLSIYRDKSQFLFFDLLGSDFICQQEEKTSIEDGLIDLYRKIQRAVEDSSQKDGRKRCCTIVIDDLSLLEVAAHGSVNNVLDFVHNCTTLTTEKDCTIVILIHDDIYTSEEDTRFVLELDYVADVIVKAGPLSTGLATDVHGQLTVLNKGTFRGRGNLRSKFHNFHFKVKENAFECFYPGSRPLL